MLCQIWARLCFAVMPCHLIVCGRGEIDFSEPQVAVRRSAGFWSVGTRCTYRQPILWQYSKYGVYNAHHPPPPTHTHPFRSCSALKGLRLVPHQLQRNAGGSAPENDGWCKIAAAYKKHYDTVFLALPLALSRKITSIIRPGLTQTSRILIINLIEQPWSLAIM